MTGLHEFLDSCAVSIAKRPDEFGVFVAYRDAHGGHDLLGGPIVRGASLVYFPDGKTEEDYARWQAARLADRAQRRAAWRVTHPEEGP